MPAGKPAKNAKRRRCGRARNAAEQERDDIRRLFSGTARRKCKKLNDRPLSRTLCCWQTLMHASIPLKRAPTQPIERYHMDKIPHSVWQQAEWHHPDFGAKNSRHYL